MRFDEYARHDALGLAALLRKGEVRTSELVEIAQARIDEVNPRINAVVQKRAVDEGPLPEGPFKGVPFLLKDLLVSEAGFPTTQGSRFFRDWVADHDSELVARHRRAGLVMLGKTASSELGILPMVETAAYGITRNPWALDRTSGGSSGGAASAVAAGIVPLAHASDGGGSIRIPASCCGLFGLKPTRGRNPFGPDFGEGWHGIAQEHCVSRSVRDSAALLDATAGPDEGAPYFAPPPPRPYLEEAARDPGKLRIAYTARSLLGHEVHPDCVAAVQQAARLCASLGHHVEEAAPEFDRLALVRAYLILVSSDVAAALDGGARMMRRKLEARLFEPGTWFLAQVGRAHSAAELSLAEHEIHLAGRAMARWFSRYDLLLTPTVALPPPRVGELQPRPLELAGLALLRALPSRRALHAAIAQLAERAFEFAAFTPIANLTGHPAMSVPLHWSAAGLPIGAHFMGRMNAEGVLFSLAAQLEKAQPWFEKRAPL
ncbi:MAG: amidase [Myxococcales bacterium]